MWSLLAAIGVMSAMLEEGEQIRSEIQNPKVVQIGCHEFVCGEFCGQEVVFALSGVGKVSAATTASLMISVFNVDEIVFTGVAGGGKNTKVGDVVIGNVFVQHDMDARPIFPQFFLFSLNEQKLRAPSDRVAKMEAAATRFIEADKNVKTQPRVHVGPIISGDRFVNSRADSHALHKTIKEVLDLEWKAIEMEGAAVAQVCSELNIPFVVIRAISDQADDDASVDFLSFVDQTAKRYSYGILKEYVRSFEK